MKRLLLEPSQTAEWHALIREAQARRSVSLEEDLESYLVFLLMRFMTESSLLKSILAIEFLRELEKPVAHNNIQVVGDKCLLFSGLFPGIAKRRRLEISYFVQVGQSAYATAALQQSQGIAELMQKLEYGFINMMDVLHACRGKDLDGFVSAQIKSIDNPSLH